MRSIAADIGLLSHTHTAGSRSSDWNSHGLSLLGALRTWVSAAIGDAQLAKLPSHLLSDIQGEDAPRRTESHVRDEFGRPVY